jgi:hypothetical protein
VRGDRPVAEEDQHQPNPYREITDMYRNYAWLPAAAFLAFLAVACSDTTTSPDLLTPGDASMTVTVEDNPYGWSPAVCPTTGTGDPAWTKIDAASGGASGAWGSFNYSGTIFDYEVFAGYTLEFCLKYSTSVTVITVEGYEDGSYDTGQNALSHTAWRILEEPTGELVGLTVSKSAEASYDRTVEWDLVKKVRLASSDFGTGVDFLQLPGVPGQSFDIVWDVIVTKDEVVDNFKVWGVITITNPNPVSVEVDVTDQLDDGTVALVDCDPADLTDPETYVDNATGILVGAESYVECGYIAYPDDDSATENEAEVVVDQDSYVLPPGYTGSIVGDVAYADVIFEENLIGFDEGVLTDDRFPEYEETLYDSEDVEFPETFECPTDVEEYDENGVCVIYEENTATLTFEDDSYLEDDAAIEITCTGLYGCTPGFWKVPVHWGHWGPTGYLPGDLVNTVFNPSNFGTSTLVEALDFGGGPGVNGAQQILLRAAVASLLNFAHPDVNFAIPDLPGITDAPGLIDAVNAALATGNRGTMLTLATQLDDANNAVNLCALDGQSFLD